MVCCVIAWKLVMCSGYICIGQVTSCVHKLLAHSEHRHIAPFCDIHQVGICICNSFFSKTCCHSLTHNNLGTANVHLISPKTPQ